MRRDAAIESFFDNFTRSLTAGDGQATASCFEYPSLMVMSAVGGYNGTQPISSLDEAIDFFSKAPEQYHAKGVEETFPDIEEVQWLSHDLALVRAHFPYIDADGNDMGDGETSVYLIRKQTAPAPSPFTICAAVTLGVDSDRAQLRRQGRTAMAAA